MPSAIATAGVQDFLNSRQQNKLIETQQESQQQAFDFFQNQQGQALDALNAGYQIPEGFSLEDIYGRPVADVYDELGGVTDFFTPLTQSDPGLQGVFADAIQGNINNLPLAQQLTSSINDFTQQENVDRINFFDPNALSTIANNGANANLLSQGVIPQADQRRLAQLRNERRNATGGTTSNTDRLTAADLGLLQLDLQKSAPTLLNQTINAINAIDPFSTKVTPQNYLANPSQIAGYAVNENQVDANFARTERDTALGIYSAPDSVGAGLFNTGLQRAGIEAGILSQGLGEGIGNIDIPQTTSPFASLFTPRTAKQAESTSPVQDAFSQIFGNIGLPGIKGELPNGNSSLENVFANLFANQTA